MSSMNGQRDRLRNGERGSIMIMTAIFALLLLLMVGMAIDLSRIYSVRAELQNAADAAALTAGRELNSGTGGIDDAITRARAIVNTKGFGKTSVSVATISFAVNLNDNPYILAYDSSNASVNANAAKAQAANIRFVKVTTQPATTNILFASSALGASHTESREAVAGASEPITSICDFFPVAVALDPAVQPGDDPLTGYPAPNTPMTLNFTQGNGNSMTVVDKDYIIVDVPEIQGNGAKETIRLGGGVTSICQTLNANVPFHATPSSNQNNGPRQITDGVNTRFNEYANGPGQLNPIDFPPDSNVQPNISFSQYDNRTAVTPPSPNAPGKDDRRILIVPIVSPGTYTGNPVQAKTMKLGAFFLKKRSVVDSPCSRTGGCAKLEVEWIDEALVLGSGSVSGCSSGTLTLAVLYK